ncbi:hypothetical protein GCM10010182_69230 [Actinomadura cremea]|nr:hypothetical protein GCM10010182_69230 [Actinomadura cremea]
MPQRPGRPSPRRPERRSRARRLARAGTASAAVSAGALTLLFTAPAVHAAGAAEVCEKGTDPASTIENWKCELGNIREALTSGEPSPGPSAPPSSAPAKPSEPADEPEKPAPAPEPERSGTEEGGGGGGSDGGSDGAGGAPPPEPEGLTGEAPAALTGAEAPAVPEPPGDVLPSPEVAPEPVAAPEPQTRLVAPVSATGERTDRAVWVAAAAASAGAVAALHLSVAGRVMRGRHAPAAARTRARTRR